MIAAAETAGLDDPRYQADRKRDIALSRQAGIDAALDFSGADALIAPMSAAAKCTGKAGAPVLAIPVGRRYKRRAVRRDFVRVDWQLTPLCSRSVLRWRQSLGSA